MKPFQGWEEINPNELQNGVKQVLQNALKGYYLLLINNIVVYDELFILLLLIIDLSIFLHM